MRIDLEMRGSLGYNFIKETEICPIKQGRISI